MLNETLTYKKHGIMSEMQAAVSLYYKIDIKKLIGLGTNRANVMVGSKSGVSVQLKENKRMISEDKRYVPDHGKESKNVPKNLPSIIYHTAPFFNHVTDDTKKPVV
ncbi:hypothetical protein CHS0354_008059 [Potamilus streckersoni]|uniref:Uncharacterized protein n=1 Tax=Potamilus streckersoni TaxID=2493646 RepID=A0AAE0S864_9BIVA|nr:hypothetical protein CHS0354_008059 [Potamilus streckersoni]